ncbi:mycofactocin biosynthesis peptidyl-dipeptidase MftE [Nocardia sp. NPDC005978]|uniref:mycofactocin biosynthesis peptidyl-dipeptidase MftE n=1 Tax=Nocardia sp. NPDC005978 TaxID=3156725 RepID=UPI0033A06085
MNDSPPVDLVRHRSPELGARPRVLLAVPVGATEQHGPHLPLDTDTAVAVELCRRLAARVPDVVVAPAIPYGSSGEHAGFPGTLSIGRHALRVLLVELVRSADEFAGVILVNGHGGNLEPLHAAARILRYEGRHVLAWSPTGNPDDSHAGHAETSVMLRLRPESVAMERLEPGETRPLGEIIDQLRQHGVAAVSANGVLGDPTRANAEDGERLLETWATALAERVGRHFPRAATATDVPTPAETPALPL